VPVGFGGAYFRQNKKRFELELDDEGIPSVLLQDSEEQKRAEFTLRRDQSFCLIAYDTEGGDIPPIINGTHHERKRKDEE